MARMRFWRSPQSFPVGIFLIALILRLAPVVALRGIGIGLDDMFQYDMLARSLVAGNGYRWYAEADLPLITPWVHLDLNSVEYDPRGVLTSFRPPLYPAFLALIYLFSGVNAGRFFIARLVQAALAASLAPLTYALARHVFPDEDKVQRIAAWTIALYPMLVIYPLSLATENLFFVLAVLALLALLKAMKSTAADSPRRNFPSKLLAGMHRGRWFILAGVLLGLLALTRSVALVFAGLAVLWVWFALRKKRMAILLTLAMLAVVLPWVIRNSLLDHRLTGIENSLGYQLYVGYHPAGTGTFQFPQSLDLMTMLDDGQRDQVGMARAMEFIREDPARVPYLALRRAGYFFGLERRALTYFYSNNFFGHLPTGLLLAIAGIVLLPFCIVSTSATIGLALIRWRKETVLMALFLAGYTVPHLLIIAEDRFHLAVLPFLAMLAGLFWTGGWAALRSRWQTKYGKIALVLGVTAVALLLFNWGAELWRDADKLSLLLGPNGNQTYFPY
jgi:hypothetical protein